MRSIVISAVLAAACSLVLPITNIAQKVDIPAPSGSVEFGESIHTLPNGNFVVVDTKFDINGTVPDAGAVHLYDGADFSLISTLQGGSSGDRVGEEILVLSNGNFFVASYQWDDGSNTNAGAVTFCNGITGCTGTVSESNSLIGSTTDDQVGLWITKLPNDNIVVASRLWDDGAKINVGAATFCSGTVGCTGRVSSSNSLAGERDGDQVGHTVTLLSNGNYVLESGLYDAGTVTDAGHATWCSGLTGCAGLIDSTNSVVGTNVQDAVSGVVRLSGGRYAIRAANWSSPSANAVGAVRFCASNGGCVGEITTANSIHGTIFGDRIGSNGMVELSTGAFVIDSINADINGVQTSGAVTFCSDAASCVGPVTAANSLHGTTLGDAVGGKGIVPLSNGNYVVLSAFWHNGAVVDAGAATFCSGTTGCVGPVTTSNSLHGTNPDDEVGRNALALPNGNYAVISENWNGGATDGGAVTFCSGTTGCTGAVTTSNSLYGSNNADRVGNMINDVLTNGNFVIRTEDWGDNDLGAVTFCTATTGCPTGPVSATNSLIGGTANDRVGSLFAEPLDNGNYLVSSPDWDRPAPLTGGGPWVNAGAVTLCSGVTGCTGVVTESNSLVGSDDNSRLGRRAGLLNGKYVVGTELYDSDSHVNAGAVKFCDSNAGCTGTIQSTDDFLFGTSTDDQVGNRGITVLENGDYVVFSQSFAAISPLSEEKASNMELGGGPAQRNGAITFGDGLNGTFGPVTEENSVIGTSSSGGARLSFDYDAVNDRLIVGRPADELVTVFTRRVRNADPYDFDNDGRTDIGIFRPLDGQWWIDRSDDGLTVQTLGLENDYLVPSDYDGDGLSDVAVWRPGAPTIAAFYILNSSDSTLEIKPFGQTGDDPRITGDWDGDGKADPAVYREGAVGPQSFFYYQGSDENPGNDVTYLPWGVDGDEPVRGDFDGDGIRDLAVYRASVGKWIIKGSFDERVRWETYGLSSDIRIPGDFDGDGRTDLAVYRPSEGFWYIRQSSNDEQKFFHWGTSSDFPVPGDYDGDGKTDVAVYRDGTWYIRESSSGAFAPQFFGLSGDVPIPASLTIN
ncbi:MAG: VCBS repeat-containing protein [Pyrinomonadaceae bacterium]|nr:VCBS repeat-containing protein [Pyrinomonadaceae bacterium]